MALSTEVIARTCARHPWRVVATWIGVLVAAFACIGLLLAGRLTTDGAPTNNPDSKRAKDTIASSFSPSARSEATDLVLVRSAQYSTVDPRFRSFVVSLVHHSQKTPGVASARSYVTSNDPALVSRDGHATMIPLDVPDDGDIGNVISIVDRANADPAFAVFITGSDTLNHDFNELSQHDPRCAISALE